jgi:predicted enzyme related to lactoylglutathione lyase
MKKFYDDVMTNAPGVKSLLGPEGRFPQRLVSMQSGDSDVGMMGFLEYLNASFTVMPFVRKPGSVYPVMVEFAVPDIEATVTKVVEMGQPIIGGPFYGQSDGGAYGVATFLDPNGVLILATDCVTGQSNPAPAASAIRRVVIPTARNKAGPSAQLLQEALDMNVFSDETFGSARTAALLDLDETAVARVITLRQGTEDHGMVGFMEVLEPELDINPFVKRENYPYEVILVFVVDDIDRVLSKALPLGARLIGRRTYEVPGRGMAEGAMFTDSNGVVIDLTRWLGSQTR